MALEACCNAMTTTLQALHGALRAAPAPLRSQALLVAGAGGALGSAVLAEALVAGRFTRVQALTAAALASTLRGLQPVSPSALADGSVALADTAIIVLERERLAGGRDAAFVQPAPDDLLPLARLLHARGVRRLVVLVPHTPALLPQALRHGFASLTEGALAALGFEQLVLVRAAQHRAAARGGSRLQRFAAWWLAQLRWMVPQREQPLRTATLALCAVQLARQLGGAPHGTRVLAPEDLWQAAGSAGGIDAALHAWLHGTAAAGALP